MLLRLGCLLRSGLDVCGRADGSDGQKRPGGSELACKEVSTVAVLFDLLGGFVDRSVGSSLDVVAALGDDQQVVAQVPRIDFRASWQRTAEEGDDRGSTSRNS